MFNHKLKESAYTIESSREEWEKVKTTYSNSIVSVLKMRVRDVLKVYHPDGYCDKHQCFLSSAVYKRKELGKWSFRHLEIGVALVRREK